MQNDTECNLKLAEIQNFPSRTACWSSHTPTIRKYRILKLHDSTQNPFSLPSIEYLQTPLIFLPLWMENYMQKCQSLWISASHILFLYSYIIVVFKYYNSGAFKP